MTPLTELWQAAITWIATHAVTPTVHWLDIAQAAGDPRELAESALIEGPWSSSPVPMRLIDVVSSSTLSPKYR